MEQGRQKTLNSSGQTLIETLAAVFILAMGMTASVGLAIFALNSSGGVVKQIIATGLAREGLEAMRNMRDTNWLQGTLSTDCTGFPSGTANCYKEWDTTPYCIDDGGNGGNCSGNSGPRYFVQFDSSASGVGFWTLKKTSAGAAKYGLMFTSSPADSGFYYTGNGGLACDSTVIGISDFCRRILVSQVTTSPYDSPDQTDVGPALFIKSQVWWVDKKCPRAADFANAPVSCRLELDTYLTNWKNF